MRKITEILILSVILILPPSLTPLSADEPAPTVSEFVGAAGKGDKAVLKKYLSSGGDINAEAKFRGLALVSATQHPALLKFLIKKGADVNRRDRFGKSALDMAAWRGYAKSAKILLEHGADPGSPNKDGEPPLYFAALSGHLEIVKLLIEHGADVRFKNPDGESLLFSAVQGGNGEVVSLFLDQGLNPNEQTAKGETAVFFAVFGGGRDVLNVLKAHGADINKPIRFGKTPLLIALEMQTWAPETFMAEQKIKALGLEGAEILLDIGANTKISDLNGTTPLMAAATISSENLINKILHNGAYVDAQNSEKMTALMMAVGDGQIKNIQDLLTGGANPNLQDSHGRTALMYAAAGGVSGIMKILMAHDASSLIKDFDGRNALDWALMSQDQTAVSELKEAGAEPSGLETETPEDLRRLVISLRRTSCFGPCPVYSLRVFGEGYVVFQGKRNVCVKGRRIGPLERYKIRELVGAFHEAGYDSLADKYLRRDVTDGSTVTTSISSPGVSKEIPHYLGDRSAPKALSSLEDKIDRIAMSERWVGKEGKEFGDGACKLNFYNPFIDYR